MIKKTWQSIKPILIFMVVLGVAFGSGYYVRGIANEKKAEVVETSNETSDLKLPGEEEKRVVTKEEVHSKLIEISEFSTYSGEYDAEKAAEYSRYLFGDEKDNKDGIKIPGTTNTVHVTCKGIVKVGYDFNAIVIKVDNESEKIYISLPEAKINDNYVIWDTVSCKETNCILNPIDFGQYKQLISELEELGLKDVESKGIYDSAEQNIKKIISNTLSGFEGFEVIFM